ncbi:MAG: DMT(drug/metabolite transporter) superfamily permease [Firmicutes bacterium]|nr:DMT(drug/metabolite transporter) superfamily permease [Bacillota bacterium]
MTTTHKAYLYLLITFFAWGSLYVVSKFVLGKLPVITISFLRYLIAGVILYLILRQRQVKKIDPQDYKYIFLIGFLGYFVAIGAQLLGTKLSNASLASLVNSMNPVVIMIFAVFLLKEKLTVKKITCGILAIVGVYIIVGGAGGDGQLLGVLVSIFSVILWSLVAVIVRQITQKYDAFQITTYGIIIAALCTFPFSLWELAVTPDVQFDTSVVLALLYIGVICTALSHVLWNKSLSLIEAGTCSLFYPLQPMVAVFLGWLLLGESISLNFVVGAILIIGGVLFSIIDKQEA